MLSGIAKVALNTTALAPVGLCYAWVAGMEGFPFIAGYIVYLCIWLLLVCHYILTSAQKYIEPEPLTISSAECADGESVAMMLVYILPLFTSTFSELNWQVWVPALFVFSLIISTGHCISFNPLLRILGWHFYKIDTPEGISHLLITRRSIKDARTKLSIVPLTEHVLVELQEKSL